MTQFADAYKKHPIFTFNLHAFASESDLLAAVQAKDSLDLIWGGMIASLFSSLSFFVVLLVLFSFIVYFN
jgi:hypothetical protein